jgi:hypothetical protein
MIQQLFTASDAELRQKFAEEVLWSLLILPLPELPRALAMIAAATRDESVEAIVAAMPDRLQRLDAALSELTQQCGCPAHRINTARQRQPLAALVTVLRACPVCTEYIFEMESAIEALDDELRTLTAFVRNTTRVGIRDLGEN